MFVFLSLDITVHSSFASDEVVLDLIRASVVVARISPTDFYSKSYGGLYGSQIGRLSRK